MTDPSCHRQLRRYWFALSSGAGIGVTAASDEEAREFAESTRARYFPDAALGGVVRDVDVSTLDAEHVLPNLGLVPVRGVWFPPLNVR